VLSTSPPRQQDLDEAAEWIEALASKGRRPKPKATTEPLVELDRPEAIAKAIDYLVNHAPEAVEGAGGDAETFRVAARTVRDFGLSKQTAFALIGEHWNEAGKAIPPWSAEDLWQKIENAWNHGTGAIGGALGVAEFDDTTEGVTSPSQGEVKKPRFDLPIKDLGALQWRNTSNYIVRNLLNYSMIGLVAGASNTGKSPFALDLAAHIALGKEWQGRKVKKGYVLYLATEGWTAIENRLEAVRRVHFATGEQPAFSYAAMPLNLREPPPGFIKALCEFIKDKAASFGVPPALIVVDTLSHTLGGGSDKDDDVGRAVIANCQKIAAATGAAMLLLHHPTKAADSDYRGTSVWTNDTDILIKVENDPKTKTRTVTSPRVKESAEMEPIHFRIKQVTLGVDEEGDEITSVVVDWISDFDVEMPRRADDEAVLAALRECAERDPAGVGFGEWLTAYVDNTGQEGDDGKPLPTARAAFKNSMGRLRKSGDVEKTSSGKWLPKARPNPDK
jgi:hypothetical protein